MISVKDRKLSVVRMIGNAISMKASHIISNSFAQWKRCVTSDHNQEAKLDVLR